MYKDVVKEELIGLDIKIVEAENKSLLNLEGKIIDETKNMFTIETKKGRKRIIKKQVSILIKKHNLKIDGKWLTKRPEERIKTKVK